MLRSHTGVAVVFVPLVFFAVAGCTAIPPIQSDEQVPVAAIINDAVCQTQAAFDSIAVDGDVSYFNPAYWTISISLTPQSTFQFDNGFGGGFKDNPYATHGRSAFVAALAGTAPIPAANFDSAGYTKGSASYLLASADLYREPGDEFITNVCAPIKARTEPTHGNIAHNLEIESWIRRAIAPASAKLIKFQTGAGTTSLTFSKDLIVYFGAGATIGYTVPNAEWTLGASIASERKTDVTLAMVFIYSPPKTQGVLTPIPRLGDFKLWMPKPDANTVSKEVIDKLNQIQLLQALPQ